MDFNITVRYSSYTFVRPLQHTYTASIGTLTTSTITLMSSVDSFTFMVSITLSRPLYDMLRVPTSTILPVHQSQNLYLQSRDLYMHSHDLYLYKDSLVLPSLNILGLMQDNCIIAS
jgi:hypothetical protein